MTTGRINQVTLLNPGDGGCEEHNARTHRVSQMSCKLQSRQRDNARQTFANPHIREQPRKLQREAMQWPEKLVTDWNPITPTRVSSANSVQIQL